MLAGMNLIWDAFVRALRDAVRGHVLLWTLLPLLLLLGVLLLGLASSPWWGDWLEEVRSSLQAYAQAWGWAQNGWLLWLAGALLLGIAGTAVLVVVLLCSAVVMGPAMAALVARQRFAHLQRLQGGSWWGSLAVTLGCSLLALVVLVLSAPLWLIPPLVLVLPPVIAGWLTYRVMTYDTLAAHASASERRQLLVRHRWPLWGMGVVCALATAVPAALWWSLWLLLPGLWLYAWLLAFTALWFAHYTLSALYLLRAQRAG